MVCLSKLFGELDVLRLQLADVLHGHLEPSLEVFHLLPAARAARGRVLGPFFRFGQASVELLVLVAKLRELDDCRLDRAVGIARSGTFQVAFLPDPLCGRFGVRELFLQIAELLVERLELIAPRGGEVGADLLDLLLRFVVDLFEL